MNDAINYFVHIAIKVKTDVTQRGAVKPASKSKPVTKSNCCVTGGV